MSLKNFRGIHDPVNIMGISSLVNDFDDVKSGVDLLDIEREIVNRLKAKTQNHQSAPEIFKQELDRVLKNIDGVDLYSGKEGYTHVQNQFDKPTHQVDEEDGDSDDASSIGSSASAVSHKTRQSNHFNQSGQSNHFNQSGQSNHFNQSRQSKQSNQFDQTVKYGPSGDFKFVKSGWYDRKTHEEKAQDVINNVLSTVGDDTRHYKRSTSNDINPQDRELEELIAQEQEKDMKAMLIAQYDMHKSALKDDGVDLSRVPNVTEESPLRVIDAALRMLRHKNDLRRYTSIGEDAILFAAYGLESAFDGKTSYLGYYPTLSGWPDAIKPRIRRMRADTSSVVASVMNNFNFGSVARMALELVPSAFLYSRTRSQQEQSRPKGEIDDGGWRDSIHQLDSIEAKE